MDTAGAEISVPATLQATIAARIDRLDPKAKRALSAAAVVGSRFTLDLLEALDIEPVIADLVAAQLVDQVKFTQVLEFAFHNPLIRAVAYEAHLRSDRADLHRRVAAAIEQQSGGSADENAALIAEHLAAAGDLQAAYEWHMRAGTWLNNRDIAAARVSWDRARQAADALPDDHPDRTAMRITPRTALCATDWRVHADDSIVRFEELRELCAIAGDETSVAIGIMGPMAVHLQRGEVHEAQQLASEQMALLDSIGDPSLTAQAGFGAMGVKMQAGEVGEVSRWAHDTIEWADGDPEKANLIVGSPLAVALALRGVTRSWFGRPGWRQDLDDAVAFAEQSAEPLTLAVTMSFKYGTGAWNGVLPADAAAVRTTENALRTAGASGNDYAVVMIMWILSSMLLLRGAAGDLHRGLDLLAQVRDASVRQGFLGSELPVMDVYLGRERARNGDPDGGIPVLRNSLDAMIAWGQVGYYIPAFGVLVETLLDRGTAGDITEAEAAIARLEAAPAEGSVIREVWLLRMRALLVRARGDEASYRDYRDRCCALATSLGFEGHMAWAEAMP
jgi:hypothetical protein